MIFPFYSDAQKILSGSPIENLKSVTGKLDARLKKLEGEGKKPGMFFLSPKKARALGWKKTFDFASNTKLFFVAENALPEKQVLAWPIQCQSNISSSRTISSWWWRVIS